MTVAEMVALAKGLAGSLPKAQEELLPALCEAAEAGLRQQLRPGAADFEQALGIAAVMAALGQLRALDGEPERFTAGDFSVTMGRQNSLCAQAQALLRPWMAEGFAFRRV